MLQFDEYKVKLNNLLPQLDELEKALNLESAAREVDFLEAQSASDGFWDNPENSQRVLQKLKQLKNKLESQEKRRASWEDMMVLCEMGNEEEDESLLPELEEEYNALIQSVESAKLQTLLTGEYDASNAIWPSMPVPAERKPRTGPKCFTACTPAGPNVMASPIRSWTIRRETKLD